MNGLFLSLQDVNARTMEARRDGGLHVCLETHQKVVCLGLVDGNARTTEARRDGGLHVCLETHQKFVPGPAGSEGTGNHSQQGGGTCIYCKEHGRSLAHRSKRIHGELVFALLILTSWGLHVFSRHMRTLFLHQNRLELSKGGFTGDGSSLG